MLFEILIYGVIGLLAGLLAGLLGIGGGVIVVPGLATAFAQFNIPPEAVMHMAASTALTSILFTAISAVYHQHQQHTIEWNLFRQLAPGIILGTVFGAITANHLSSRTLQILFGIFMLFVALRILFSKKQHAYEKAELKSFTRLMIGIAIGSASGLLGIGGGAVSIPVFLRLGLTPHRAAATSSACVLLLATVGTITFMLTGHHTQGLPAGSIGYVYWPAVLCIAFSSMVAVSFGTKLARKLSGTTLKKIFAIFLLVVAIEMLVR